MRRVTRALAVIGPLLLGAITAGCTAKGPAPGLASMAPRGTVAFESIDGLPEGQFHKLVQALMQEAEARQLAVVSRTENAQYRVRGYAAASVRGKRTTISWVWDIYDTERQRAVRLSGEEATSGSHRGWTVADDALINRIARDGMGQLAAFLGSPSGSPPPTPVSAPADGPAIARSAPAPSGAVTQTALANVPR